MGHGAGGRTDAEIMAGVAPPPDERWSALSAMRQWRDRDWDDAAIAELIGHLVALGLVAAHGDPFPADQRPGGPGLPPASPADAVRVITAAVRRERTSPGTLAIGLRDGSIEAALARIRSRRP